MTPTARNYTKKNHRRWILLPFAVALPFSTRDNHVVLPVSQFCKRLFRIDIKVEQLPATRTTNLMLTRFTRQAQKGFAVFTVAEYVLRVIFRALPATARGKFMDKTQKSLIFPPATGDISGHNTEEYIKQEQQSDHVKYGISNNAPKCLFAEQTNHPSRDNDNHIKYNQNVVKCINSVPAVKKAGNPFFEISHRFFIHLLFSVSAARKKRTHRTSQTTLPEP